MMWILALLTGLTASLHCVGMCGPIALALPVGGLLPGQARAGRLLYNLGRTASYTLLGAGVGLLGERLTLAGLQRPLSVAAGLVLVLLFAGRRWAGRPAFASAFFPGKFFSNLLKSKRMPAFLGLGVLNGLLPCGMVYVALAAALGLGTVQQAAAFMFFYGLGTAPAMLGIGWVWQRVTPALRRRMGVAVPLYTLALGLLLLWRGLALGLPLSPAAPAAGHAGPAAVMCK